MVFQQAVKMQTSLKVGISGPSGSGKTFTALSIAKGLGGRIAVVDTENNSASLYADRFQFDTWPISPPYTVEKYLEAIAAAEQEGYTLILDSISHAWAGEGGILDQKNKLDERGGNSYVNWGKMTPIQEKFVSRILNAKINIIATMRSKQQYVLQENSKGRQAPVKMGMAPVQRDGMEYEFTVVFDMDMAHNATASKDRTGMYSTTIPFAIGEGTGVDLLVWRTGAQPAAQPVQQQAQQPEQMGAGQSDPTPPSSSGQMPPPPTAPPADNAERPKRTLKALRSEAGEVFDNGGMAAINADFWPKYLEESADWPGDVVQKVEAAIADMVAEAETDEAPEGF